MILQLHKTHVCKYSDSDTVFFYFFNLLIYTAMDNIVTLYTGPIICTILDCILDFTALNENLVSLLSHKNEYITYIIYIYALNFKKFNNIHIS
jgi:hypothetical protein